MRDKANAGWRATGKRDNPQPGAREAREPESRPDEYQEPGMIQVHVYRAYIKKEMTVALCYAMALALFGYLIVVIFPTIAKIQALKDYIEMMPPFLKAFIGQDVIEFTKLEGFLSVEFFNTTWLLITGVFTCMFASAIVVEETERKTLEILLSTPLRRTRFVIEKFAGFVTLLAVVTAASFAGIYLGALRIGEKLDAALYFHVCIAGFACMTAIGGIGLFFSCISNEQRRASSLSLVFFFTLYLFNLIATLLEQYPVLKYFSLFHYYDASVIFARGSVSAVDTLILAAVFAVMFFASLFHFQRKDIYL